MFALKRRQHWWLNKGDGLPVVSRDSLPVQGYRWSQEPVQSTGLVYWSLITMSLLTMEVERRGEVGVIWGGLFHSMGGHSLTVCILLEVTVMVISLGDKCCFKIPHMWLRLRVETLCMLTSYHALDPKQTARPELTPKTVTAEMNKQYNILSMRQLHMCPSCKEMLRSTSWTRRQTHVLTPFLVRKCHPLLGEDISVGW